LYNIELSGIEIQGLLYLGSWNSLLKEAMYILAVETC
jgi:hypothetical protein